MNPFLVEADDGQMPVATAMIVGVLPSRLPQDPSLRDPACAFLLREPSRRTGAQRVAASRVPKAGPPNRCNRIGPIWAVQWGKLRELAFTQRHINLARQLDEAVARLQVPEVLTEPGEQ